MKNCIPILFCVLWLVSFSNKAVSQTTIQDSVPGTYFTLRNNEVVFAKVYESTLAESDLRDKIDYMVTNLGGFEVKRNGQSPDQINGTIKESIVNYRKFGGTLMGTNYMLNSPFDANVIIQIKGNRYRVLVTNIIFKDVPNVLNLNTALNYTLDDVVTKKKRTAFRNNNAAFEIVDYTSRHLEDMFELKPVRTNADEW